MFPNLDVEAIKAVLRANNGDVNEAIDQLLMGGDCTTDRASAARASVGRLKYHGKQNMLKLLF